MVAARANGQWPRHSCYVAFIEIAQDSEEEDKRKRVIAEGAIRTSRDLDSQ